MAGVEGVEGAGETAGIAGVVWALGDGWLAAEDDATEATVAVLAGRTLNPTVAEGLAAGDAWVLAGVCAVAPMDAV